MIIIELSLFIDNVLYPNVFAICEILKQTNCPQLLLVVKQAKDMTKGLR